MQDCSSQSHFSHDFYVFNEKLDDESQTWRVDDINTLVSEIPGRSKIKID